MAHINPISLDELKDNATNCRVTRHLPATPTLEHDSPTEAKPASTILTQGVKMGYILLDPKLDSKVLKKQAIGYSVKLEMQCLCERLNT